MDVIRTKATRFSDNYYRGHIEKCKFGVGFVAEELRRRVRALTPVGERLATIRIEAKLFNTTLICVHAPTVEKDNLAKYDFYERCPQHDEKLVLGDFSAGVVKEGIFVATVGKIQPHSETCPNGFPQPTECCAV